MDSVPAPRHRSRWSLLSLLVLAAPLAMLNPSLADPLKQLETGFCSGCALSGADLRGRDLRGFYLIGADLRGADLIGADLSGANLEGADLSGANLEGAQLQGSRLSNADLRGANLRFADLTDAIAIQAITEGAQVEGLEFSGAELYRSNLIVGGDDNPATAINQRLILSPGIPARKWWLVIGNKRNTRSFEAKVVQANTQTTHTGVRAEVGLDLIGAAQPTQGKQRIGDFSVKITRITSDVVTDGAIKTKGPTNCCVQATPKRCPHRQSDQMRTDYHQLLPLRYQKEREAGVIKQGAIEMPKRQTWTA